MDLSVWITYFIATIVLSVSPGPGVFSSISSGLHHGFRLGLWNGVGMQAANFLMVIVVSLGLGAILLASETLFTVVKWAGVAYLVYLGIVTWRAPARGFEEDRGDHETTARGVFMRGFWVNATNPKGLVFFLAVLPQFVVPTEPLLPQYLAVGVTMVAVDLVVMGLYTGLSVRLLKWLHTPRRQTVLNRVFSALFAAAAVVLSLVRRGPATA